MDDTPIYSREELARLRQAARKGGGLRCPRCGEALEARSVPPRREVSYVRRRTWWICPGCRRSAVLDRERRRPDPRPRPDDPEGPGGA